MLQLTRRADYGIRLMLEAASHAEAPLTTAQRLKEAAEAATNVDPRRS